jgi:phosphoglycolate phosphatase-like HAD superfamily hydrolase
MPIETVLFDWDGALIDTAQMAFVAFKRALVDLGLIPKHVDSDGFQRVLQFQQGLMFDVG